MGNAHERRDWHYPEGLFAVLSLLVIPGRLILRCASARCLNLYVAIGEGRRLAWPKVFGIALNGAKYVHIPLTPSPRAIISYSQLPFKGKKRLDSHNNDDTSTGGRQKRPLRSEEGRLPSASERDVEFDLGCLEKIPRV